MAFKKCSGTFEHLNMERREATFVECLLRCGSDCVLHGGYFLLQAQ